MTGLRIIVALFAIAAGVWLATSGSSTPNAKPAAPGGGFHLPTAGSTHPTTGSTHPTADSTHPTAIQGRFDGLAIQVYSAKDALATYRRLIREVADLGASCVMLSVNGYQERVESTLIHTDPANCPPDDVWLQLFDCAHGAGLKVVLMPKILLTHPDGKWRGKIQPPSWDAWFAQYRKFIRRFAALAEAGGVEMFIVGSELVSTEKHTDHWKALIGETRKVFSGLLAYSANWDHYTGIQFWQDLDVIGLTTYHKLSDTPGPSLDELRQAWKPIRDKILAWRKTVDRPIIFTEVGWCSQEGCSVEAWNYYLKAEATPAGHEEQRRNYQAFIDTWADEPDVLGLLWWEWDTTAGGPHSFGYTPRGKPAEEVLRKLFQRRRTSSGFRVPSSGLRVCRAGSTRLFRRMVGGPMALAVGDTNRTGHSRPPRLKRWATQGSDGQPRAVVGYPGQPK